MAEHNEKVGLITGACSGIGLALTQHLLSHGWNIVLADINPPPSGVSLPSDRTLYIACNVLSWDEQASLFKQAFQWKSRLDFAALNAGIDDRDDIFNTLSSEIDDVPDKPDMTCFDIDLYSVYYGIKLFAHYASFNPTPGGKIVATASAGGLYPQPAIPQYCAAKHGVVGLVRCLAPLSIAKNITLNCICPAMVPTNLPPAGLMKNMPEHQITPLSTVMRAYDELLDDKERRNGCSAEIAVNDILYRTPIEPLTESQKWLKGNREMQRAWMEVYTRRNASFVKKKGSKL